MPRPKSRRPARARELLLALACAACLPEQPPEWLILDPRFFLLEVEVIATGALSKPLDLDPPGRTRREGLPGDRIRIRPVIVGPGGPITPRDPPLLIRSGFVVFAPDPDGALPECAEDGLDGLRDCRIRGDELALPPLPPAELGSSFWPKLWVIVSDPEGPGADECYRRLITRDDDGLFECHIDDFRLDYGPPNRVADLQDQGDYYQPVELDYNLSAAWLELSIDEGAQTRMLRADHGDTIAVAPDARIRAELKIDEDELQRWATYPRGEVFDEVLSPRWATTDPDAALDPDAWAWSVGQRVELLAGPREPGGYHLYVDVRTRVRSSRFLWVRIVPDGPGDAAP
ncbi:MAG: hypothetical protein H6710_18410 [Myxococcales bacterium]|nr:hypothetical protein [Myxococcales bacterium]